MGDVGQDEIVGVVIGVDFTEADYTVVHVAVPRETRVGKCTVAIQPTEKRSEVEAKVAWR